MKNLLAAAESEKAREYPRHNIQTQLPGDALLQWFKKNKRPLPWRQKYRPYDVLVSEFMLQQTRVEQMLPYYKKWMKQFPTLQKLAKAHGQDVLKAWEGLGYYSRAQNLHETAKEIVRHYQGQIPSRTTELIELPGIGPYIAGAVSSIAFNRAEIVLDGNVGRVLARWLGTTKDIRRPPAQTRFQRLLQRSLPNENPRDFNQALMELGALVCTPRNPDCPRCPLSSTCQARKKGFQNQLPARPRAKKKPARNFAAIWVEKKDAIWLEKRSERLLNGTYELPLVPTGPGLQIPAEIERKFLKKYKAQIKIGPELGTAIQEYSHFQQRIRLYRARFISNPARPMFGKKQRMRLPISRINQKLLALAEAMHSTPTNK